MSENSKFVIMLEITGGVSKRLFFSLDSLKDDNIVAIMDEIHEVIWLWMGKNTGLIERRGAMRAARSLKAYGHEIGQSIVGRKLNEPLDIRGEAIESEQEQKERYETVSSLFQQDFSLKYDDVLAEFKGLGFKSSNLKYGLTTEQRNELVKAALASPSAGDDSRAIEEIVGEFQAAPPEESSTASIIPKQKVSSIPTPSKKPIKAQQKTPSIPVPTPSSKPAVIKQKIELDENTQGDIKAAILINAVLSKINEIFVGVKKNADGSSTYSLEGPNGETCKYTIKGSKINFLPGSWENIDQDTKQDIQKLFLDRIKLILRQD